VEDGFDVVAVQVSERRGVVAGIVVGTLAGWDAVDGSRLEPDGVERPHDVHVGNDDGEVRFWVGVPSSRVRLAASLRTFSRPGRSSSRSPSTGATAV
jgi:hypothetical protein